ncbi:MAG: transcription elongation factor GreA [Sphingobacteriales bacterium]|jgi:transcription elongation factor GreA
MSDFNYFTKEGLDKLKAEIRELKTKGRPDMSRQIGEARDKGDLSENAEYDAAKNAQGLMEMRISQLEGVLGKARLIDESKIDTTKVLILSKVKVRNLGNGIETVYQLVSEKEADLKTGRISIKSPVAKGLLGKSVGDKAEVQAPNGKMEFEVLEISR